MKILYPLVAVLALIAVALLGAMMPGGQYLFGVILPYLAFAVFIGGVVWRVVNWGKSPVPFRIPTTCGQEESLPWIKQDKFDNPSTTGGVIVRMLLEVFLFRSLFRNTKAEIYDGPKLVYGSSKYLWLFGLLFHYCFLVIVLRHLRLFTDPIPGFVAALEMGDGALQIGVPVIYQTDLIFPLAILFLFGRRLITRHVRYISLAADYFPLFLIFAIAVTGILMRFVFRVDVTAIKQLTAGLAAFRPTIAGDIGVIFYAHVFLVCTLMVYFPFSKLMHAGGVFLSPTRNMANNSRKVRHINPWNPTHIKPHSYASYEDEFREFMVDAGIPVEKELEAQPAEAAEGEKAE
ncbi:MAG: sulfate reduction electron transfer complex DsrMKJOP subunit DsrM [Thermodesulfobacteriota bacterium]